MLTRRARRLTLHIALIAAVLLGAALGVCVFETGHEGHGAQGMALDLCTGLVLVLTSIVLLVSPLSAVAVLLEPRALADVACVHLPDPPPKALLLSFA